MIVLILIALVLILVFNERALEWFLMLGFLFGVGWALFLIMNQ